MQPFGILSFYRLRSILGLAMKKYNCPVCGYDSLEHPPANEMICPSCGTHFGYHDFSNSYDELRKLWIASGANWFSPVDSRPPNWSALEQLQRAGRRRR